MRQLHHHWQNILIRGLFAVLFGLAAILWPGLGFALLVLIFGAYALVDGLIALVVGFPIQSPSLILEGIIGVLAGGVIFFYTQEAAAVFIFVVGVWAIISGIFEIIAAIELRKHIKNEFWLLFAGVVSVLFGVLVFKNPASAGLAIGFVIGMYALLFGLALIALSQKAKNYAPAKSPRKKKA